MENTKESPEPSKDAIPSSQGEKAFSDSPSFMTVPDETIKTDIDDLIKLISEKREISMADAAKFLGVTPQTVESWSIFLEEDGVIDVKYKLTTPYLVAKGHEETQLAIQEKAEKSQKNTINQVLVKEKLYTPFTKKTSVENLTVPVLFKEAAKEIDSLLNKAYELIKEGKFEEANKVYELIKRENETLPTGLSEFKKDISINLTKLNKELIVNIEKYNLRASAELSKYISGKLTKLSRYVQTGEIKEAEDTYIDIQAAFSAFPPGFETRKAELQARVIDVYKRLLTKKRVLISKYNANKSAQIKNVIEEIKTALRSDKAEIASQKYDEARQLYSELPEGFTEENEALTRELFSLVPEIITSRKKYSTEEYTSLSTKLRGLMSSTRESMIQNRIEAAERYYAELKETYARLPKDFFNKRADLEEEILDLEHQLLLRSKSTAAVKLKEATSALNSLIKTAKDYIKRNNAELAEGIYYEMLGIYRQIPEGFMEQKTVLGVEVLTIFREIMLKYDEEMLKGLDEKTTAVYQKIIQLLTTLRGDIEAERLDVVENKFAEISELFGHLPFKFVQEDTKLWREVQLLSTEIELLQKARKITSYKDNLPMLKSILEEMRVGYLQIYNQFQDFPDYSKLLTFVKDNYLFYYNLLYSAKLTDIPVDSRIPPSQLPPAVRIGKSLATDRISRPEPKEEGPFLPPEELSVPMPGARGPEAMQIGTIRVAPRIEMPSMLHPEAGPEALDTLLPDTPEEQAEASRTEGQALPNPPVEEESVEGEPKPRTNEAAPENTSGKQGEKFSVKQGDKSGDRQEYRSEDKQSGKEMPKDIPKVIFPEKHPRRKSVRQSRFISDYMPDKEQGQTEEIKYAHTLPEAPSREPEHPEEHHLKIYMPPKKTLPSSRQAPPPIKEPSPKPAEPMPEEITPDKLRENLILNLLDAGDGRMKLRRFDDAEKTYQQVLAFDGFNKKARERLEELEQLRKDTSPETLKINEFPAPPSINLAGVAQAGQAPDEEEIEFLTSKLDTFDRLIKAELAGAPAKKARSQESRKAPKRKKRR